MNDIPDPPADFEQDQAALWYRYADNLHRHGILFDDNLDTLEVYTLGMYLLQKARELRMPEGEDIRTLHLKTTAAAWLLALEPPAKLETKQYMHCMVLR